MRWLKIVLASLSVAVALGACSDSGSHKYFETKGLRAPESACLINPQSLGQVERAPDIHEASGCEVTNRYDVQSLAGIQFSQTATMNCGLTGPLNDWLGQTVQNSAQEAFGERVVGIDVAASYSCRPRNNVRGAKMSEHGFGNAIDIAAFTLEDGRKVSVLHDYYGSAASQRFLRQVRGEACGEFATVLGPGTDANHRDHIHLDLQNRRSGQAYCH
jgi:hypothetical protein